MNSEIIISTTNFYNKKRIFPHKMHSKLEIIVGLCYNESIRTMGNANNVFPEKGKGGMLMKRCSAVLLACMLFFAGFLTFRVSAENAATKVELYCTVNSDGDCLVSMSVNLHLDTPNDGLMFPLPYSANDITLNGASVFTSRVGNVIQAAVGRAANGLAGDIPLRFDFRLPKAVHVNAERKLQLDVPMLCGFDYPVSSLSFIVTLPDTVPGQPSFFSIYLQNGFESNLDMVVNGNMITGATKNALNDHEAVTMTLLVPQSMFPSVSTYQREGNPELIPMGISAALALVYWIVFLRTLPPVRQRAAVPPEGITAGELNCRVTMSGGDLTMMVLSWAQMGYLLIQQNAKGRVFLTKQMEMGNERNLFEIRVYQALFKNRNIVDCSSAGYAKLCAKTAAMVPGEKTMCKPNSGSRKVFRTLLCIGQVFCGICVTMNMTSIVVLQILFSLIFGLMSAVSAWIMQDFAESIRARYKIRAWIGLGIAAFWVVMGAIASQPWIPLGAVVVQLLCSYLVAYGGMRTELNRNEAGEILGIRRYTKHLEPKEAKRLLEADPEYFYRMAPYAIALGTAKSFARSFGRRKMNPCPYFISERLRGKRTAQEWLDAMNKAVAAMDERYQRSRRDRWLAVRFR